MRKPKEKFSKGMRVRVIKTDLPSLEIEHAKHEAGKTGAKRLPFTEIHHNPDNEEFHVMTRDHPKDPRSNERPPVKHTVMKEPEFLEHALNISKSHPKMHPFPKEARMIVNKHGHVDFHIAHPDY